MNQELESPRVHAGEYVKALWYNFWKDDVKSWGFSWRERTQPTPRNTAEVVTNGIGEIVEGTSLNAYIVATPTMLTTMPPRIWKL